METKGFCGGRRGVGGGPGRQGEREHDGANDGEGNPKRK